MPKKTIIFDAVTTEEVKTKPIQSANTLFHMVDKLDYLIPLIVDKALTARYCKENIEFLDIGIKELAYPMICFCDLNIHRLHNHLLIYGKYGIAFSKDWGVNNGIQPIQYINENSVLRRDFCEAFNAALTANNSSDALRNYILTAMYFFKPLSGSMSRTDGDIDCCFTDECEWRYIPNLVEVGMPQLLKSEKLSMRENLNDLLRKIERCKLKFTFSDIKYIIVEKRSDVNELVKTLRKNKIELSVIYELLSKTLVWNEIEEDI